MADVSPMMKQYLRIKEENPNTILFFRLGDFYEMFYNDALVASKELELTLTGKNCGQEERAPMCGIPFHSVDGYIARLVAKGYKVAICEQTEDPATAKGLVSRDVIRVVTPGTLLEGDLLDESSNNYICSVFCDGTAAGVCFADVSTGELSVTQLQAETAAELSVMLQNELSRCAPKEVLLSDALAEDRILQSFLKTRLCAMTEYPPLQSFDYDAACISVPAQFGGKTLQALGIAELTLCVRAIGALLLYLQQTQQTGLERLNTVSVYSESQYMHLDANARRNLELLETMRSKEKRGSLLWVLDKTKTSMGKRLMKNWLLRPLMSPAQIIRRQNAVDELFHDRELLDCICEQLTGIFDMERLMTRVVYGSANGRELRSLWGALCKLPALKATLAKAKSGLLAELLGDMDVLEDVAALIDSAIVEDPPFTIREGGIIRAGFHEELDSIRHDMTGGKELIAQLEAKERERTGNPKLRVGYNRVFGYYIEVFNSFKEQLPGDYVRKQTLANCERFITEELKNLENRILGAHDKSILLETRLFGEVRTQVAQNLERVQRTAHAVATLDVLASFAFVAAQNDYTRPTVNLGGAIRLKDSRHPVVEMLVDDHRFVPNDVELNMSQSRVVILTGPNMAGKSTYMRQIAIITLMAQLGSFVPASYAEIGIVDSIYTRVGASDDLSMGQSTFMVEMTEVADILKNATSRSLLILDEIGRGTSTYDGMSIARAVLEHVQNPRLLGAKTLFATHYHELTELENQLEGVVNYSTAVKKHGDDITFLRRIIRGGADDSYGIEVSKLAGIPETVVRRAKQILASLEAGKDVPVKKGRRQGEEPVQITMDTPQGEVLQKLKAVDVNTLTPMESMNLLFELAQKLKRGV